MDKFEFHVKKNFYCSFIVQAAGSEKAYRPFVLPYGDYSFLLCSLTKINNRRKKVLLCSIISFDSSEDENKMYYSPFKNFINYMCKYMLKLNVISKIL